MRGIVATTDLPQIISGCLDMLPHERRWENAEFEEWLEMFESACRVWYCLPRGKAERLAAVRFAVQSNEPESR